MKKIAIIGAGYTGLMAAYELAKQGQAVTVFEKNTDIGGLAGGFTLEGANLEKAYHHLFRTDTDILSLISELGMENELLWLESKVGMVVRSDRADRFSLHPFNGALDLLRYKPLPLFDRMRAGAVLFFLQKYTGWKTLISKTAKEWMTKWSGPRVMETIWGPLLKGKFAAYADKVSMAWLWARIHIRANSRKSLFEKEMLAYPRKGFLSIAEALAQKAAALQHREIGDVVRTNVEITKIETFSDENLPVQITVNGEIESFDAVLSTIPTHVLTKLLVSPQPSEPVQPLSEINYLSAVVLAFSSSQSLSPYYWHNIIDSSAPFLVFLQHTNLVPSAWYQGAHVYYIGVYLPPTHPYLTEEKYKDGEHIKDEWYAYLAKIFPAFKKEFIRESKLFTFPHAQHVVDTTYDKKILPYKTPFPHIFSATFSQIFPEDRGTNYAIREGRKIASIITQELVQ